jgi:hypothetical protein
LKCRLATIGVFSRHTGKREQEYFIHEEGISWMRKTFIGIDLSTASEVLIELIIEDAVDLQSLKRSPGRPQAWDFKAFLDSPETPDEARALCPVC